MSQFYYKVGNLDSRVTTLEDQVLDLTELTDGDFLQYNESESALVPKSVAEMKTLLGIHPTYVVIQQFTGNGSTVSNFNPTLFTNGIPNSTIDTDWTRAASGQYYKNITSTGDAFTSGSFSSQRIVDSGIVVDEAAGEVARGFYYSYVTWTGSTWRLVLYTFDTDGVFADLVFATTPNLIRTGLNSA